MAIKSALRPESIVRTKPKSVQSAQNFISGGALLGSSVVSSAANKIVGFQRAAVKPVAPDINSIVSTISSNILNQVDNSIRNATNITNRQVDGKLKQVAANITNQVQQVKQEQTNQVTQLQTVVQNIRQQTNNFVKQLSENYKKRVQDVDTAKPIGILDKFLKAYQNAISFIQFFGNGKNIKQLRESLQTLKTSFTESFEIAKLIRQTILKIVTQLSNLPKATPGTSPGLNLDIDVPGGPLKRTAPRNARFGGKGAGMLGLGLGAVAAGTAVNALADSDRLQTLPQVVGGLTGGIVDSFTFIVNKFANAVEEMIKGGSKKEKPSTQPGPSSSGAPSSPASPGSSPGGMPGGATVTDTGSPEQQSLLKTLRYAEGTEKSYGTIFGGNVVKELQDGKLTVQEVINMADTGKLPQRLGGGSVPGYGKGSKATGAYQFMPDTLEGLIKQGTLKPDELFTNAIQDRAALQLAANRGVTADVLKKEGFSKNVASRLAPVWASVEDPKLGRSYYGQSFKPYGTLEAKYKGYLTKTPDKGMGMLEGIDPSMIDAGQRKALGINISQPPPSQAKPSIVSLPLSGGQQTGQPQSGGGGGQIIIPPEQKGPSVPLLPSSDDNNFLTMYSKIVYNIVDG